MLLDDDKQKYPILISLHKSGSTWINSFIHKRYRRIGATLPPRNQYTEFFCKNRGENKKHKLSYLKQLNLLNFDKKPLPNSNINARIIFLKNDKDFGYLAYQNFDNILKWNRSNYFAIAVGTLSDHILFNK